jgi:NAD-dependent dihydropyrimidine dehydrogenase PreA subunit
MQSDIPIIRMDGLEAPSVVTPINTLVFFPGKCVNCGRCLEVCPHRVLQRSEGKVRLARPESCMECGACQLNCTASAIKVDSGVGCAAAMIRAAIRGKKEVICGEDCCE